MSFFITRVELHDYATKTDYDVLHAQMQLQGFQRTILATDGHAYHMLPAEYNIVSNLTTQQVLTKAQEAANVTGKKYSAFVTQALDCWWSGLRMAR